MKKASVKILCLCLIVILICGNVFAATTISNLSDSMISTMMNAMDSQRFDGTGISLVEAKNYVQHYLRYSSFAAIGGGTFNYPNSARGYFYSVTDGTYSAKLSEGAKGCKAYALYVSHVMYGKEGDGNHRPSLPKNAADLKSYLLKNAQAGEQIRAWKSNAKQHSMVFISATNEGFFVFSYEGDIGTGGGYIRLRYFTYSDFLSTYGSYSILVLRNVNENVNNDTAANPVVRQPVEAKSAPTLSIRDTTAPTTLKKGASFGLRGIIESNGIITTVWGDVHTTDGTVLLNGQYHPNSSSHDLRYSINNDLVFGSLPSGTYIYQVRAKAEKDGLVTEKTLIQQTFTVQDPAPQAVKPTISASEVNYPSGVKYGKSFGLRGVFSSNGTITGIYGEISKNGERVQWQTIYPNSSSVNIRYTAINDNLEFNKLAKGTYIYYLEVQAEKDGKYVNWTNGGVQFTVS